MLREMVEMDYVYVSTTGWKLEYWYVTKANCRDKVIHIVHGFMLLFVCLFSFLWLYVILVSNKN